MWNKEVQIKLLKKELSKQQGIFNKHAPKAINPNSKGYEEALKAFNQADRRIKEIYKELVRLRD